MQDAGFVLLPLRVRTSPLPHSALPSFQTSIRPHAATKLRTAAYLFWDDTPWDRVLLVLPDAGTDLLFSRAQRPSLIHAVVLLRRHLPADVRADQEGRRLVIRSPDRFEDWLGEVDAGGVLDKIRAFLGA